MKSNFTRTSLTVLLSLVFVAGVGTAYAGIVLPTITLGGNVEVIGDMTFLSDNTSVKFPATSLPNQPMIEMFDSGINNADRMVIGHSPNFPNWGLEYRDTVDEFVFRAGSTDSLTIDLDNGDVFSNGEYKYSAPKTRSVLIAPAELSADSNTSLVVASNGESAFIATGSTDNEVFASIPNLPDNATITKLECRQVDSSEAYSSSCILRRADFLGSEEALASVVTSGSGGFQTGFDDIIANPIVDRDAYSYYLEWSVSNSACNNQCGFISAKITFTVPRAD